MTTFSVRAARPADHPGLAEILAELLSRQDLTEALTAALNTNLLKFLSTPGTALLVAEDEEKKLLGFVSLWSRWGILDQTPSGHIDRVVVRRDFRETSVAHALLEQALGACQALGCGGVEFVPAEGSMIPEDAIATLGFSPVATGRYLLEIV